MARSLYSNAHPLATKEMVTLTEAVIQGDRVRTQMFLERLGTADGVWAFAGIAEAQLQADFGTAETIWQKFAERKVVSDFRKVQWIDLSHSFANFKAEDKGVKRAPGALPKVAEGEKYQAFSLSSSTLNFAIEKFGAQFGLTWEAFVNDPYDIVGKLPTIFRNASVDTLDANATKALFAGADAAPHLAAMTASTSPTGVAVAADAALSYDSLVAARAQLKGKKDSVGNYVAPGKLVLNVAPSLVPVAEAILAMQTVTQRSGSATNFRDTVSATALGDIEIVENRFLSFYSGNESTWILSPAAGAGIGTKPAVIQAFLAGEEEPEIRVSGLAGYTPNGQALPFTSGSFDTDSFDLRVRLVGGAGVVDAAPFLLSDGTGA